MGSMAPAPSSRAAAGSPLAFLERRPWPSVLVGIVFVVICALASAAPVDAGPADRILAVTVEPIDQVGDTRLDESAAGDGASGAAIPPAVLPDTAVTP